MIDCPVDLETQYTTLELIVTLNNEPQKIGEQESSRVAAQQSDSPTKWVKRGGGPAQ